MDTNLSGLALIATQPGRFDAREEDAYYASPSWDWRLPAWIGRLATALASARENLAAVTTARVTFS